MEKYRLSINVSKTDQKRQKCTIKIFHQNYSVEFRRKFPFCHIFFRIKLMECKYCFGWKMEDRQTAVTSVPFAVARKQLDLWIRGKLYGFQVRYCFQNTPQSYIWFLWITSNDVIKTLGIFAFFLLFLILNYYLLNAKIYNVYFTSMFVD